MLSPSTHTADDVIALLRLAPLPHEGGWFRRVGEGELRASDASGRRAWSSILALFTPDGFSALHRLVNDEIWCFHAGDPLVSLRLHPEGRGEIVTLGTDVTADERLHDVVRAGVWQGTRLREGGRWALVTCVVAPEFRWEDFELGSRAALHASFSTWSAEIEKLTRS